MRASSLKWSIIPILFYVYNFYVDPHWHYPSDLKVKWTVAWLYLSPVLGLMTARSLFLAFKKHYDLTPTVGSRIVDILAKVLSVVAAVTIGPVVMMVLFAIFALITLMILKPFLG